MKYNPTGKPLQGGKMVQKFAYKKGVFVVDLDKVADIITEGGQVEIKSQQVQELRGVGLVQVMDVRIYFIGENDNNEE